MQLLNTHKLMKDNPLLLSWDINQLNQIVNFYEHPTKGDEHPIIAVINGIACNTGFYNMDDFYKGSDYMPVLHGNQIMCYFELQQSLIHYLGEFTDGQGNIIKVRDLFDDSFELCYDTLRFENRTDYINFLLETYCKPTREY